MFRNQRLDKIIGQFYMDFIVAKPGMGKSSSMAMLAMKWVKGEKGGE